MGESDAYLASCLTTSVTPVDWLVSFPPLHMQGSENPNSRDLDATIRQHDYSNSGKLDLTKKLSTTSETVSLSSSSASAVATAIQATGRPIRASFNLFCLRCVILPFDADSATAIASRTLAPLSSEPAVPTRQVGGSNGGSLASGAYTSTQKLIIAHAVLGGLGAMIFLPAGVVRRCHPLRGPGGHR